MPPTFVRRSPIDSEWAEALVGLRLNVPNWWPGFVDGSLNRGRIAAVNLGAPNKFYFEVDLDDELGAHYAMRYDSVLLYVDEGQPGFLQFCLPMLCPCNPVDKMVRVRVLHGKNGGTMVDDDYTDKEFIDEGGDDDDVDLLIAAMTPSRTHHSYSNGVPATKRKREKGGATTKTAEKRAAKHNNKRQHKTNATINPDSVLLRGEGGADGEERRATQMATAEGTTMTTIRTTIYLRRRGTRKQRQKIGQSNPMDVQGERFVRYLSEGRRRHFAQRYPTRS
jgi:hypothetical protein